MILSTPLHLLSLCAGHYLVSQISWWLLAHVGRSQPSYWHTICCKVLCGAFVTACTGRTCVLLAQTNHKIWLFSDKSSSKQLKLHVGLLISVGDLFLDPPWGKLLKNLWMQQECTFVCIGRFLRCREAGRSLFLKPEMPLRNLQKALWSAWRLCAASPHYRSPPEMTVSAFPNQNFKNQGQFEAVF